MAVYLAWRTVSCLGWLLSEEAGTRDLLISYRPEIKGQGQKLARLYPKAHPRWPSFSRQALCFKGATASQNSTGS